MICFVKRELPHLLWIGSSSAIWISPLAVHYSQHGDFLDAVNFVNKAAVIKVSQIGNHDAFPVLADMN